VGGRNRWSAARGAVAALAPHFTAGVEGGGASKIGEGGASAKIRLGRGPCRRAIHSRRLAEINAGPPKQSSQE